LLDVNLVYKLGDIGIAFEFANQSQSCVTKFAKGCTPLTRTDLALGLAMPAGSGRAHYVSTATKATFYDFSVGDVDVSETLATNQTQILVEYVIPMTAGFRLVPLFGTDSTVSTTEEKDVSTKTVTTSATMVALGARGDF
jgi:hypothetical protein